MNTAAVIAHSIKNAVALATIRKGIRLVMMIVMNAHDKQRNHLRRKELAASLRRLATQLEGGDIKKLKGPNGWASKLLEGESSTLESTYLLYLPVSADEEGTSCAMIPFEVLHAEWRAWWTTFTASIMPEQEEPAAYAKPDILRKEHCSLQDIRWYSLLTGTRTNDPDPIENILRVNEARKLLAHLFGKS